MAVARDWTYVTYINFPCVPIKVRQLVIIYKGHY